MRRLWLFELARPTPDADLLYQGIFEMAVSPVAAAKSSQVAKQRHSFRWIVATPGSPTGHRRDLDRGLHAAERAGDPFDTGTDPHRSSARRWISVGATGGWRSNDGDYLTQRRL